MDWADLLEAVFGGGSSSGGGGKGLTSAWQFGLAQYSSQVPVIGQYVGYYLTGTEDLSDLTGELPESDVRDPFGFVTIDDDAPRSERLGDWGSPEEGRSEDNSRSPWLHDRNQIADNSGTFVVGASYKENTLNLDTLFPRQPGPLGATIEPDGIETVYIRGIHPDRSNNSSGQQAVGIPPDFWRHSGSHGTFVRPERIFDKYERPGPRPENAATPREELWSPPPPQAPEGPRSLGDWFYQDSKGGFWLPPEKGDLFTLNPPIDTGSTLTNYLANGWLSVGNLMGAFINLPFEILTAFDDAMRRSSFSQEWDAFQTMDPFIPAMGLAGEGAAGLRYLSMWLANDERLQGALMSMAFSSMSVGGICGGAPLRRIARSGARRTSMSSGAAPAAGRSVGSSSALRTRFMREMLEVILSDKRHPLRFLVDLQTQDWRGRSHLADAPSVQAGHLESNWLVRAVGGVERFAVEDAFLNQYTNWTGETGGKVAMLKEAVLVKGVFVEWRTLRLWAEMEPTLGKFLKAARVLGWTGE
ncbi:polymorphic toxin type 5 domain-containing protein [Cupriavidus sp. BIS7]|uniref:polymorphic toxin type 5 domain-containing protein n=1 Tax=Cupriavidus sp. BIS7 TaxID=1217718 RepID=UPI0002EBA467|nr:polymorphic toxin type 5 domain-containing protein [Cupriavidus sp. BIS7]